MKNVATFLNNLGKVVIGQVLMAGLLAGLSTMNLWPTSTLVLLIWAFIGGGIFAVLAVTGRNTFACMAIGAIILEAISFSEYREKAATLRTERELQIVALMSTVALIVFSLAWLLNKYSPPTEKMSSELISVQDRPLTDAQGYSSIKPATGETIKLD